MAVIPFRMVDVPLRMVAIYGCKSFRDLEVLELSSLETNSIEQDMLSTIQIHVLEILQ